MLQDSLTVNLNKGK